MENGNGFGCHRNLAGQIPKSEYCCREGEAGGIPACSGDTSQTKSTKINSNGTEITTKDTTTTSNQPKTGVSSNYGDNMQITSSIEILQLTGSSGGSFGNISLEQVIPLTAQVLACGHSLYKIKFIAKYRLQYKQKQEH